MNLVSEGRSLGYGGQNLKFLFSRPILFLSFRNNIKPTLRVNRNLSYRTGASTSSPIVQTFLLPISTGLTLETYLLSWQRDSNKESILKLREKNSRIYQNLFNRPLSNFIENYRGEKVFMNFLFLNNFE